MTIFAIIVGISSLIPIAWWLWKAIRFIGSHLMYPDLAIGPTGDIEATTRFDEVRIKLAYAGRSSLVVQSLRLRFYLKYPSFGKRMLAWLQLALGYLVNDIEGLKELVGPRLEVLDQTRSSRALNFFYGLLWFTFILSLAISPFGWLLLLFAGPYDSRELNANDKQIRMEEAGTASLYSRPFIIRPRTEKTYVLSFDYLFRSQNKPEGYPSNTRAEYMHVVKQEPWWRLPRAGQGIWMSEGVLFVQTRSRWSNYKVSLGSRPVRLLPSN